MRFSTHDRDDRELEEGKEMPMAPDVREWTADDLADMPADGQRYEVIDGALFVTPSPSLRHQDAIRQLLVLLSPYVEAHRIGHLVISPADVTFSRRRVVQPDLFVTPLIDGRRPRQLLDIRELVLAVEVASASTARVDRREKRAMYRDQGVEEYWVVDLDSRTIERYTPAALHVEVNEDSMTWQPTGAAAPLIVDLKGYFVEVLDR